MSIPPPLPPPIPQHVLGYSTPQSEVGRPWLLAALSVLAILGALVSIALSAGTAWAFRTNAQLSTPPPPPAPPTPLPPANLAPFDGFVSRDGGLTGDARVKLANRFPLSGPFAVDRQLMLHRLVAEAGANLGSPVQPSVETGRPISEPAAWLPNIFPTDRGTVTVGNQYASFEPTAGGATYVKQFRTQNLNGTLNSAVAIEEKLADLKRELPQVTPLQLARLAQLLDAPAQVPTGPRPPAPGRVAPPTPPTRPNPREDVTLHTCYFYDGTVLSATTDTGTWYILADGRSASAAAAPLRLDPVAGAIRPVPAKPFVPRLPGSPTAMWAIAIHGAVACLAAVLLLAIATAQLCGWPSAGRWYMRWAGVKILLIVAQAAIASWFIASMDMNRSARVMSPIGVYIGLAIGVIVIQIVCVAAVLLVMMSRRVREYYAYYGEDLSNLTAGTRQWLAMPSVRALVITLAAMAVLLGLSNAGFALWFAYNREASDTARAISHAFVAGLLLLPALIAARRSWATRKAALPLLLVAILASPTMAQTKPAEFDQGELQIRKQAEQLLRQMRSRGGQQIDTFDAVLEMGEPAQVPALDYMSQRISDRALVRHAAEAWGKKPPFITERNRAGAIEVLKKMNQVQDEAMDFLSLYEGMPEAAIGYAKVACGFQSPQLRKRATLKAMEVDPSGKYLLAHITANVHEPGGHPYRFFDALKLIGEPAVSTLVELTQKPDLDLRINCLRAMRPATGESFNATIADTAIELYFNGVTDLNDTDYQLKRWEQIMKAEAVATLRTLGKEGNKLADDLIAGKQPARPRRRQQLAAIDAPIDLVTALFPKDAEASVSDAQFAAIRELTGLHKNDPRAAVEKAIHLADGPNAGARVIAARFLAASPAVTADDLPRLIALAKTTKDFAVRPTVLQLLLGGKFQYSDDLRALCDALMDTPTMGGQSLAMRDLATAPLGRIALAEAIEGSPKYQHRPGTPMLDALAIQRPMLKGLRVPYGSWSQPTYRKALTAFLVDIERNPDQTALICLARLDGSDKDAAVIAGSLLESAYANHLGPQTLAKVRQLSDRRTIGNPALVVQITRPIPSGYPFAPPADVEYEPTASENWSTRAWYANGILVGIALALVALALLAPMRKA